MSVHVGQLGIPEPLNLQKISGVLFHRNSLSDGDWPRRQGGCCGMQDVSILQDRPALSTGKKHTSDGVVGEAEDDEGRG